MLSLKGGTSRRCAAAWCSRKKQSRGELGLLKVSVTINSYYEIDVSICLSKAMGDSWSGEQAPGADKGCHHEEAPFNIARRPYGCCATAGVFEGSLNQLL